MEREETLTWKDMLYLALHPGTLKSLKRYDDGFLEGVVARFEEVRSEKEPRNCPIPEILQTMSCYDRGFWEGYRL